MRTLAEISKASESTRAAREFCETVSILMNAKGRAADAVALAEATRGPNIVKAVAAAVSGSWGDELAGQSFGFTESLAPYQGVFDSAAAFAATGPMNQQFAFISAYATGAEFGGPTELKSVHELSMSTANLPEYLAYGHFVASRELVRLAGTGGNSLLARGLRIATIAATDAIFIAALIAAAPAATPSSGSPLVDVQNLLAGIALKENSHVLIVASPATVSRISMYGDSVRVFPNVGISGGPLAPGVDLIPSSQSGDTMLAFDAGSLILNRGRVLPSGADAATIDLSANESGGANVVSLFGQNLLAAKLERAFSFATIPADSVAIINSVSYTNAASG